MILVLFFKYFFHKHAMYYMGNYVENLTYMVYHISNILVKNMQNGVGKLFFSTLL